MQDKPRGLRQFVHEHPFFSLAFAWTIGVVLLRVFVFNAPDEYSLISNDDAATMLWVFGVLCVGALWLLWLIAHTAIRAWRRRQAAP